MKYIIVDSVKDGNRFLRKNNKEIPVIYNLKCVHLFDLAKEVVIRQMAEKSVIKALEIADDTIGVDLLCEILEKTINMSEDYFVPKESISSETCGEILRVMNQLRMGAVTENYQNTANGKVGQLKDLINIYEECLSKLDMYDLPLLYKTAISVLDENQISVSDKDVYEITDVCKSKLTFLEMEFLNKYTHNNWKIFSAMPDEENIKTSVSGAEFFKAYGIANEVNYVISKIIDKGQQLGDVEILYSSADYEPYIEASFSARNIPYSMINRKLSTDNIYLNVMKNILKWANGNYRYEDLKPVMISSGYGSMYFSQIKEGIGWELDRYKAYIDKYRKKENPMDEKGKKIYERQLDFCECLEALVQIFDINCGMEISYKRVCERLILATRKVLGDKADDKFATTVFKDLYKTSQNIRNTNDINEIIKMLSKELKELSYGDDETASAVCIRKIDKNIHVLERKHIYVLGMSNEHYGNSINESPVLSDEELENLLDTQKGYVAFRRQETEDKRKALNATLASRDAKGTLTIGYCCYDTVKLIGRAPSIPYIRMLENANVSKEDIIYVKYENIIDEDIMYSENDIWKETDIKINSETSSEINSEESLSPIDRWSTTSLQQLLKCPRSFYYQRVLLLPEESYKIPKADAWLMANEKGTLTHSIMEKYCNKVFLNKSAHEISPGLEENVFEEVMMSCVEEMLKVCPYFSKSAYDIECEYIKTKCRNYLERMHTEFSNPANKWIVGACEKEVSDIDIEFKTDDTSISLKFKGIIDRVDFYVDDNGKKHYRIIDYKTGKQSSNQESIDSNKTVQHIVYKFALEALYQEDIEVEEARYIHLFEENLREQEIILSGDSIENFPEKVHKYVVKILTENKFNKCNVSEESTDKNDECKYCTYKDICDEYRGV